MKREEKWRETEADIVRGWERHKSGPLYTLHPRKKKERADVNWLPVVNITADSLLPLCTKSGEKTLIAAWRGVTHNWPIRSRIGANMSALAA